MTVCRAMMSWGVGRRLLELGIARRPTPSGWDGNKRGLPARSGFHGLPEVTLRPEGFRPRQATPVRKPRLLDDQAA